MRRLVILLALTGCDRVLGLDPITSAPDGRTSGDAGPSLYATVVLEDRPLAYWRLGTASVTSAVDDSTKGNSGVFSGGVRPGAAGALVGDPDTATSFDGFDDCIISGAPFFFEGTARFTIEAWVKPSPRPDPVGVISKAAESGTSRIGYQLYSRVDAIGFERSDGVDVQDVHTDALPTGTWSYVAVTFDGLTLTLYIDGAVRSTSESGLSMLASNAAFAIGARNGGGQSFFAGAIDEVAVYDRDLTAAQIERHRRVALGQ